MHDKGLLQGRQWRWAHRTRNVDRRSCDAATFCCIVRFHVQMRGCTTKHQYPAAASCTALSTRGGGRQKRAYLLYSLGKRAYLLYSLAHVAVRFVRKNQSKGSEEGGGLQIGSPYFHCGTLTCTQCNLFAEQFLTAGAFAGCFTARPVGAAAWSFVRKQDAKGSERPFQMIAGEVQDCLPGLVTAPIYPLLSCKGRTSTPDYSGRSGSWQLAAPRMTPRMSFARLLGDPRPASVIDGLGVLS